MGLMNAAISGVMVTELKRIPTTNGDVFHAMRDGDPGFRGFGEAYFSTVQPGATKPWKRHNLATLNLIVIAGVIRFVVHDDRVESPTRGGFQVVEIGPASHYARLTIVPGLWMAFQGRANDVSIVLNIADLPHDPEEADRRTLKEIVFDWSSR